MSISLNIREWCGIHCGSFIDKDDCNELRAIVDRIDREIAEYERMKKEVDELKAELNDWRGNAEGFEPDAYMKLPLDADGVPIRIGDTVYTRDAEEYIVRGIYALADEYGISVVPLNGGTCFLTMEPEGLTHRATDSADSWEKLEEDARKTSCGYASAPRDEDGLTTCEGCRFQKSESCSQEMTLDVLKRAKKLAGIEDLEGGER